jgi:hypothetical protein
MMFLLLQKHKLIGFISTYKVYLVVFYWLFLYFLLYIEFLWFLHINTSGIERGPFAEAKMKKWYDAGHLVSSLKVRKDSEPNSALASIESRSDCSFANAKSVPIGKEIVKETRNAKADDKSGSVVNKFSSAIAESISSLGLVVSGRDEKPAFTSLGPTATRFDLILEDESKEMSFSDASQTIKFANETYL